MRSRSGHDRSTPPSPQRQPTARGPTARRVPSRVLAVAVAVVVLLAVAAVVVVRARAAALDSEVRDVRAAVDWLAARPDVDPARIGALSRSAGTARTAGVALLAPHLPADRLANAAPLPQAGLEQATPAPPGTILWTFDAFGDINGAPAIGDDGTVYLATSRGLVYAVDAAGNQRWVFDYGATHPPANMLDLSFEGAPAIGDDGTIYVADDIAVPNFVFALSPDGSLRWVYETAGVYSDMDASPALDREGRIFVGSHQGGLGWVGGSLLALDPRGNPLKRFPIWSGPADASPLVLGDDRVVFAVDAGFDVDATPAPTNPVPTAPLPPTDVPLPSPTPTTPTVTPRTPSAETPSATTPAPTSETPSGTTDTPPTEPPGTTTAPPTETPGATTTSAPTSPTPEPAGPRAYVPAAARNAGVGAASAGPSAGAAAPFRGALPGKERARADRPAAPAQPTFPPYPARLHVLSDAAAPGVAYDLPGVDRFTSPAGVTQTFFIGELMRDGSAQLAAYEVTTAVRQLWRFPLPNLFAGTPVLGWSAASASRTLSPSGTATLYYHDPRGVVVALAVPPGADVGPRVVWSVSVPPLAPGVRPWEGRGTPVLGSASMLYVPCGRYDDSGGRSQVLALRQATGEIAWSVVLPRGDITSAAALAPTGVLYVGTSSGVLYAIATESLGLDPNAVWPSFRHDARNTGRAEGGAVAP